MPMFMVLGIEGEEGQDFSDGAINEGWLTYVEARNPRAAAEAAMDETYENDIDKVVGLTLIVSAMSGKARESRFEWRRPTEAQLIAIQ